MFHFSASCLISSSLRIHSLIFFDISRWNSFHSCLLSFSTLPSDETLRPLCFCAFCSAAATVAPYENKQNVLYRSVHSHCNKNIKWDHMERKVPKYENHKIWERKVKTLTRNWRDHRGIDTQKQTETVSKYFDRHGRLCQSEESKCLWTHAKMAPLESW